MKKLIKTIALITLFILPAIAIQAQNVPSNVKKAFLKKFPNAQKVRWDKENVHEFEASFMLEGKNMSANFDLQGNWKETEVTIKRNKLPNAVKQALENDYSDKVIHETARITNSKGTFFEVEIRNAKKTEDNEAVEEKDESDEMATDLLFNQNGKLVKQNHFQSEEND